MQIVTHPAPVRILRLPDVESLTGLKKSTIYSLCKSGKFPQRVFIHRRLVGWNSESVQQWIQDRINQAAGVQ